MCPRGLVPRHQTPHASTCNHKPSTAHSNETHTHTEIIKNEIERVGLRQKPGLSLFLVVLLHQLCGPACRRSEMQRAYLSLSAFYVHFIFRTGAIRRKLSMSKQRLRRRPQKKGRLACSISHHGTTRRLLCGYCRLYCVHLLFRSHLLVRIPLHTVKDIRHTGSEYVRKQDDMRLSEAPHGADSSSTRFSFVGGS